MIEDASSLGILQMFHDREARRDPFIILTSRSVQIIIYRRGTMCTKGLNLLFCLNKPHWARYQRSATTAAPIAVCSVEAGNGVNETMIAAPP